jgi:hypothetical protein
VGCFTNLESAHPTHFERGTTPKARSERWTKEKS